MGMEDRRKNARANAAADAGSAAAHRLPDDVLASIFLRLPSLLHLVLAACACRRWRRVVSDGSFLLDFRALRVPSLVAGHFRVSRRQYGPRPPGSDAEFFPLSSSPLKDGAGAPRRLSFDFLPQRRGDLPEWEIADRRGATFLLLNEGTDATPFRFPDIVVCEPLSRGYTVVPPPEHLHGCRCIGAFLLNDDDGGGGEIHGHALVTLSRFRVLCAMFRYGVARACVFSSGSGGSWTVARSTMDSGMGFLPGLHSIVFAGQSGGYAHWVTTDDDRILLALDMDKAEFSSFYLPLRRTRLGGAGTASESSAVVMAGSALSALGRTASRCSPKQLVDGCWRLGSSCPRLPAHCQATRSGHKYFKRPGKIMSEPEGRVVVITPWEEQWLVSVDLETMEFKLEGDNTACGMAYPYVLPWPPAGLFSPI